MNGFDSDFMEAEDWKAMYLILCHTIDAAINDIDNMSGPALMEMVKGELISGLLRAKRYYVTVEDAVRGGRERLISQLEIDAMFGVE